MGIRDFLQAKKTSDGGRLHNANCNEVMKVVALTGSTGNFGSYILDALLASPTISKVYCLNRSPDAENKQTQQHKIRGLCTDFASRKTEFWKVEFDSANWGLSEDRLNVLATEVQVIIHNAWPVDFNRNFHSFSAQIDGVRHLIDMISGRTRKDSNCSPSETASHKSLDREGNNLTHRLQKPTKIFFVSSIGTVSNWAAQAPTSRESVPEAELTDWKLARTGYGQSKLLAERLLAHAAKVIGVPIDIARVGQLAGPVLHGVYGSWPTQEWLPSLIKSSETMRLVPKDLGPNDSVDWIPVDIAANVILDLIGVSGAITSSPTKRKTRDEKPQFFHIVNPKQTTWPEILPYVKSRLPAGSEEVSIEKWVDRLKASEGTSGSALGDEESNPALKLIDTFDHIQDRAIRFPDARAAVLDTIYTVESSSTLTKLEAVNGDWVELWMRQWGFEKRGRA